MKKFEFFDNTADVGIKAYGRTLEEAFENSALAVFEVMTDTSKVDPVEERKVTIDGIDLENLLYRWIEALLVYYDSELMLFSKFKVKIDQDNMRLEGEAWGEKFNEEKHERRTLVKAMTYSLMSINKVGDMYEITFVVDI
ncbi:MULTISPECIES: archease [Acidianus]|uniref:Protein archease n=2 Tax=Acidianus TaxID=12914 RepID=A0A650CYW4_ACIAM|nr:MULTISPECIES: archease [Acidianus]MCY0883658.1 archease [Acidianus infernus]MQL54869.1 archease [Acidianus ambivalens]MUM64404.1 archease [Acidianus infernus]QGR22657.1 archease [Acidianus ambivalens]